MRKLILNIILISLVASYFATAQVIRFERTDVDGKNANFVTAKYSFSIDIRVDSLNNCSNVAFELTHNQIRHVEMDGYERSED
jgi:hypothetical protein